MLDENTLRKKVLLRLLGHPFTVTPFMLGMTTLAASWAVNWRPALGLFAGLAGAMVSVGAFLSQLLINSEGLTRTVVAELAQEENLARQKSLDELEKQLVDGDDDARPETALRELRALLKAFEDSEGRENALNRTAAFDVRSMVSQLFDRCVESIRQTDRLARTAQDLKTNLARKPILLQREKIIAEVEATIKQLSHTLIAIQTMDRGEDSQSELRRLRGELDQSLTIAKTVEERVNALVKDAGNTSLEPPLQL